MDPLRAMMSTFAVQIVIHVLAFLLAKNIGGFEAFVTKYRYPLIIAGTSGMIAAPLVCLTEAMSLTTKIMIPAVIAPAVMALCAYIDLGHYIQQRIQAPDRGRKATFYVLGTMYACSLIPIAALICIAITLAIISCS